MDTTAIAADVTELVTTIGVIGAAVVGVYLAYAAFKWVKRAVA